MTWNIQDVASPLTEIEDIFETHSPDERDIRIAEEIAALRREEREFQELKARNNAGFTERNATQLDRLHGMGR